MLPNEGEFMNRKFLVVLLSCLFFSCGPTLPTIDSSTPETYNLSMDLVTSSVPEELKEKFNVSVVILAMESMKDNVVDGVIMIDDEQEPQAKQQFQKSLHGLNYKQIVEKTDQVMRSKMERAKAQYEESLLETWDEIIAAKDAEPKLAKIVTSEHKIGSENISMQIENGTKSSLTNLWFLGLVAPREDGLPSPRLAIINFEQPLAPGEKRRVIIPLKEEYGWKSTDYLAIPRITLVIVRAEDTKKKVLIHEKFAAAFDTYVALSKNYVDLVELLEGNKDWVNMFTTENIVKGFFPLK